MTGININLGKFGTFALVAMVALAGLAGLGLAHDLSPAIIDDTTVGTVNDTTNYTSSTVNTTTDQKLDYVEINVTSISGDGALYVERYNSSSGAWDNIDKISYNSTGVKTSNLSTAEAYSESNEYRIYMDASTNSSYDVEYVQLVADTQNSGPEADAGANQSALEGETVNFDGANSSDADGDSLSYSWDVDGDGVEDYNTSTPSHAFSTAGDYVVNLTVTDSHGATSTDSMTVSVSNGVPVADAGPNQSVETGTNVTFNASGSSDPDGDSLSYSWDVDGDGTEDYNGSSPVHSFTSNGTYTVDLTVTDSDGATATDTVTITVSDATYATSFNVTNSSGVSVQNATVNVSDSSGATVATLTTDANGSASTSLADGNYSYTVSATDYADSTGDISVSGASQTIDVTLSTSDGGAIIIGDGSGSLTGGQIAGIGILALLIGLLAVLGAAGRDL